MRGKSHTQLGRYLADTYFSQAPRRCRRAFLLGCIQPDRNPSTYLKGSLRAQWLRGHNYENAKYVIFRPAKRLEAKPRWNILDYYAAGKLIHYTTDAFTFAHNASFPVNLHEHKIYEDRLQTYFLQFLQTHHTPEQRPEPTIRETITKNHLAYLSCTPDIFRDARYAFGVTCCVATLLSGKLLCKL